MVNSGNVLELYQQKGQERGRWVFAPEECNQLSVLICMNGLRKQIPGHVGSTTLHTHHTHHTHLLCITSSGCTTPHTPHLHHIQDSLVVDFREGNGYTGVGDSVPFLHLVLDVLEWGPSVHHEVEDAPQRPDVTGSTHLQGACGGEWEEGGED